jgi:hypothetical protein
MTYPRKLPAHVTPVHVDPDADVWVNPVEVVCVNHCVVVTISYDGRTLRCPECDEPMYSTAWMGRNKG